MDKETLFKKLKSHCYCHAHHECHYCYMAYYVEDLIEIINEDGTETTRASVE